MKSQSWGRKGVPAFTLPPHRLRRRPRSNRHPPAIVIHNGLSTEKLSTSLLAALCKTFSPSRLRTRIYNIGFALAPLWHRGPRRRAQGGGGRKAKADAPSCSAEQCRLCAESCRLRVEPCCLCAEPCRLCADQCRLCAESLCAKVEVQQANPATARARSPRQLAYRRAPAA